MSNSEYNFNKLPGETEFQQLKRVCIDKLNKLHNKEWTDIKEELKFEQSSDTLRKISRGWLMDWEDSQGKEITQEEVDVTAKYKSTNKLNSDGSTDSDKLLKMSEAQSKDKNYLLEAHGFDANEFELLSAQSSIWNGGNSDVTLYSSKIKVKAKVNGFDMSKLLEVMKKEIPTKLIETKDGDSDNFLVIPFFDLHFGIAELSTYQHVIEKTLKILKSKKWKKVLVIFGQDQFHNDNFTGQTTSGTIIDKVDMEKAWLELHIFYTTIFDCALENSETVDAIFSNGNHDQSMGWAFGKLLEYQYPQVKFDSEMKQFKGYLWENIFIGVTHGDKGHSRVLDVFLAEYGKLIASANTKEILSGHLHHQKTHDKYGIVHRTLGSGVPSDDYHKNQGFVGSRKQFQLLEYNKDYAETVYYV